jgi:hypothetical protein
MRIAQARIDSGVIITSFVDCCPKRIFQLWSENARDNQMFGHCVGFDGSDPGQR